MEADSCRGEATEGPSATRGPRPHWLLRTEDLIGDLVAVLFNGDADQLAARADTGFIEQLLESGFDRAFRNVEAIGNLLIC